MTRRLLPLLVAAALGVPGCGGGGGTKAPGPKATASPAPTGLTEVQVNTLRLNSPRAAIIRRFGPPFDPRGVVPQKIINGIPKSVTRCDYFHIVGGKPNDFAQLCFRKGVLQSKLSLITPKSTP